MRLARSLSILSMCLVGMSGLAGYLSAATAQQPEKRIALVVGNAAYSKSPLAICVLTKGCCRAASSTTMPALSGSEAS